MCILTGCDVDAQLCVPHILSNAKLSSGRSLEKNFVILVSNPFHFALETLCCSSNQGGNKEIERGEALGVEAEDHSVLASQTVFCSLEN